MEISKKKIYRVIIENQTRKGDSQILKDYIISEVRFSNIDIPYNNPLTFEGIMLVFCIKGEALIKRNSTEITLSANSIFTILPYYVIELLSVSEDIEIECQFFSVDYIIYFF